MLYDCHTHHPSADADVRSIRNVRLGKESLPASGWYSAGIHPWDANVVSANDLLALRGADRLLAIGETGLDRLCGVSLDVQRAVFIRHVECSEAWSLPLIVHCVRAFDDVVTLRRVLRPTMPWVMHGFAKGGSVVDHVIDTGMHVSFGASLLRANATVQHALLRVPDERFLLETDDNPDVRIADVYVAAATIRNVSIESLCSTLQATFNSVFKP
jgi:TatD DNase family protein